MKRFFSVLLACCLLFSFCTACNKGSDAGYVVTYDLTRLPRTLDPQLATSSEAMMIIENTFEGLLRRSGTGKIVTGVAESFTLSDDALTYTFKLRNNAMWSDGKTHVTPVTADDFVFAFRRIVEPDTAATAASSFLCIKNAKDILAGRRPPSELGVSAPDAHTFVVELEAPNPFFTEVVTTAAAMPCNEEFFRLQKGRYGLEPSYLMYNGPFFVKDYDLESKIRLRANDNYHSETPTVAGGVDLIFQFNDNPNKDKPNAVLKTGDEKVIERIYNERTDAAAITYDDVDKLISKNNSQIYSFENKSWGLLLNCSSRTYGNEAMRRAIMLSIDYNELEPFLKDNLAPANAIVPPAVMLLDKPYREEAGENLRVETDTDIAKAQLSEGFESLEISTLAKNSIIFPTNLNFAPMLSVIQRQLQSALGVFINLEPLPLDEFNTRINSGDYLIAVASFTAGTNNPSSVLGRFTSTSQQNISGYSNASFDKALEDARVAEDIVKAAELYKNAEQMLINDCVYLPLAYETSYYAARAQLKGVTFSPFSYNIFFKFAYDEG